MRKFKFLRVLLAALSLSAVTACFLDFTGTASEWLGCTVKMQFWPGVLALSVSTIAAVLVCTLLWGRVYCSVVCPLGILQDVMIFFRRLFGFKFSASGESKPARIVREVFRLSLATAFVAGGYLGFHYRWLEPYAIYGRASSALFAPLYRMGNNALAVWAERSGSYAFHMVEIVTPPLAIMALSAALLALVCVLALWKGRFWCNTVCPVGTILGYVSKLALVKVRMDSSKCVKCGLCACACKAGAINVQTGKVDASKCVACFDCGGVCGKGALSWSK